MRWVCERLTSGDDAAEAKVRGDAPAVLTHLSEHAGAAALSDN